MVNPRDVLSARIRAARERAGRNKNQVARALGVSWQHYDHWERGKVEPSLASLRRLAEVLQVSTDYLLGIREQESPVAASAIEEYLAHLAPSDLTAEEERWLRRAPVQHEVLLPADYATLLANVRGLSPAAASSAARSARKSASPKSGPRPKVDRSRLDLDAVDDG